MKEKLTGQQWLERNLVRAGLLIPGGLQAMLAALTPAVTAPGVCRVWCSAHQREEVLVFYWQHSFGQLCPTAAMLLGRVPTGAELCRLAAPLPYAPDRE